MSLSLTEMLFSMKQIPVSQQLDGREPGFASQTRSDLSWGDLALSLVLVAAPMARVSRIDLTHYPHKKSTIKFVNGNARLKYSIRNISYDHKTNHTAGFINNQLDGLRKDCQRCRHRTFSEARHLVRYVVHLTLFIFMKRVTR